MSVIRERLYDHPVFQFSSAWSSFRSDPGVLPHSSKFQHTYPGSVYELRNNTSPLYRSDYPDISLMSIHTTPVKPRTLYVLDSFVLPFLNLWYQNPSFRLNTINAKPHYHIDPEILHTERTNT